MRTRLDRRGLSAALALAALALTTASGWAGVEAPSGAAPTGAPQQPAAQSSDPYRISPGDVLAIAVRGESDLSRECQVNGKGTVSLPLLGDVSAAGSTCQELADRLEAELRRYLRRPQVAVTVRQYGALGTSVFVAGEVQTPGLYPLAGGRGLMQALVAAGGPTKQASGRITIAKAHTGEVHVTGIEQALSGTGSDPQARLDPGDLVVVERRAQAAGGNRYAVLGEVPSPGMFEIPDGGEVRVLDAMEKAGVLSTRPGNAPGPGDRPSAEQSHADLERALLTRGQVVVALNLKALLQGDVSQNLLLQPGDVITVPRRPSVTVYALGEVRTPGRQVLDTGSTVLDLLNAAGGVTSGARLSEATILRFTQSLAGGLPRTESRGPMASGAPTATSSAARQSAEAVAVNLGKLLRSADSKENIALQEGDVLFVPARGQPARDVWGLLSLVPYAIR